MKVKSLFKLSILTATVIFIFTSCNSNKNEAPQTVTEAKDTLFEKALLYFQPFPKDSANQKLSVAKILLGKTLFYDKRLSKNNTQSCNTCHNLETFGVDNLATSAGDLGKHGNRNSPTVLNAAFHSMQFWDGRAKDVEEQAGMPILNPVEMNMPSEKFVEDRLKSISGYKKLFSEAFPESSNPITYQNLRDAIGAFERTLATPSKFHQYLDGNKQALNEDEKKGLETFINVGCITCHSSYTLGGKMLQKFPLIGNNYSQLTGSKVEDLGLMEQTKKETDKFIFKVPSLLNITETHPYFHDGSVAELSTAIKLMGKLQLNKELNEGEVSSIKTFLTTLKGQVPQDAKNIPAMP